MLRLGKEMSARDGVRLAKRWVDWAIRSHLFFHWLPHWQEVWFPLHSHPHWLLSLSLSLRQWEFRWGLLTFAVLPFLRPQFLITCLQAIAGESVLENQVSSCRSAQNVTTLERDCEIRCPWPYILFYILKIEWIPVLWGYPVCKDKGKDRIDLSRKAICRLQYPAPRIRGHETVHCNKTQGQRGNSLLLLLLC